MSESDISLYTCPSWPSSPFPEPLRICQAAGPGLSYPGLLSLDIAWLQSPSHLTFSPRDDWKHLHSTCSSSSNLRSQASQALAPANPVPLKRTVGAVGRWVKVWEWLPLGLAQGEISDLLSRAV